MTNKEKVFDIVSKIPVGKVVTYGQLARMVSTGPRVIGNYLNKNKDPKTYPCHRVVHSDGTLAVGYAFGGQDKQRNLLANEGVCLKIKRLT